MNVIMVIMIIYLILLTAAAVLLEFQGKVVLVLCGPELDPSDTGTHVEWKVLESTDAHLLR